MTDSRRADPKRQPWSIDEGSTKVGRVPITLVVTAPERRQSIDEQMRSAGPVKKQEGQPAMSQHRGEGTTAAVSVVHSCTLLLLLLLRLNGCHNPALLTLTMPHGMANRRKRLLPQ